MYTFKLTSEFLAKDEQNVFSNFLNHYGLEENVWPVFESMFKSKISGNIPLVLKAYEDKELCGATVIIKCSKYGRALVQSKWLSKVANLGSLPFYLWIKFGCCMDMMSNPGFVREPGKEAEIHAEMARFLQNHSLLTIINDFDFNSSLYPSSSVLPSLPHALIETKQLGSLQEYVSLHKNIKKKLRVFKNKGGTFELIKGKLNEADLNSLRECFISTSEQSIFYLPYQDLYLNSALNTSRTDLENVYYFIARINGEFLGYQAAIKSGKHLNALHGAFDRRRQTTFHAYDILFVKMTEFALENGLDNIDFGAVLNVTKQRMVNKKVNMSYYLFSKYKSLQLFMKKLLEFTDIQSEEQMRFREV